MIAATTVNVRLVIAVSLTDPHAWRGQPRHVTREPGSRFQHGPIQVRNRTTITRSARAKPSLKIDPARHLAPHSCSSRCDRYRMMASAGGHGISEAIHAN